jgi:hypothetical protein
VSQASRLRRSSAPTARAKVSSAARAHYPDIPAVGRFEYEAFNPETWVPEYRNPAFKIRLPDDAFWAAKQVMAFTDEQIRALVSTGESSDPRAEEWITRCLIERRNKIGGAFFAPVLPLDRFEIRDGRLEFDDLAARHKMAPPREYNVEWSLFNNETSASMPVAGATGLTLPAPFLNAGDGSYFAATIRREDKQPSIVVCLRKAPHGFKVAGIERAWQFPARLKKRNSPCRGGCRDMESSDFPGKLTES